MTDEFKRIGSITKPHGLKGALKVYPTTDDESRFDVGNKLFLEYKSETIELTIEKSSKFKNLFILIFDKYHDINEVEQYKGCDLWIKRDDENELGDNEFYIDDLIDMEVVDEEDKPLGKITQVMTTGANDVYVVGKGKDEILIPAIADCILSVSVEDNLMRVHLLEGLV